jgi:hypothetical protein
MGEHEHWKSEPDESDYPAAARYLSLLLDDEKSQTVARLLAAAPLVHHRVNDLLRASALPLLSPDDLAVAKDLDKVKKGRALSPVLLVRGELGRHRLVVADGYHRICASYHLGEDTDIPCRMVALPA